MGKSTFLEGTSPRKEMARGAKEMARVAKEMVRGAKEMARGAKEMEGNGWGSKEMFQTFQKPMEEATFLEGLSLAGASILRIGQSLILEMESQINQSLAGGLQMNGWRQAACLGLAYA